MDEFNPNQNPQQPEQEIPSVPQPNPIPATPQAPTEPQINVQPPVYNVQPPVNPQINQPGPHSSSNGLAIAGLVCGIVGLALCIVIIACVAAWISSLSYGPNYYYDYFSTM